MMFVFVDALAAQDVVCFLPLEDCKVSSGTMKVVFWGEEFREVPIQGGLDPAFEVHCVFSNRKFPSTSEWQPRAISIASNVLGTYLTDLNNTSRVDFSFLVLMFVLLLQGLDY